MTATVTAPLQPLHHYSHGAATATGMAEPDLQLAEAMLQLQVLQTASPPRTRAAPQEFVSQGAGGQWPGVRAVAGRGGSSSSGAVAGHGLRVLSPWQLQQHQRQVCEAVAEGEGGPPPEQQQGGGGCSGAALAGRPAVSSGATCFLQSLLSAGPRRGQPGLGREQGGADGARGVRGQMGTLEIVRTSLKQMLKRAGQVGGWAGARVGGFHRATALPACAARITSTAYVALRVAAFASPAFSSLRV